MFIRLNRAFTVLELLLVLAIMTVLVSIVVFSLRPEDIFQTTNKLEIENDTKEIQTAYTTYKLNNDGNSPFGGDLISGMAYKICKEEITDCDINNFEVSLNPLKAARLLKNIPEIPDNEDLRYTGYVLSDVNGTSLSITTQTELVYSPENTTPGESFTYNGKSYTVIEGSSGSIWLDRNLGATSIPTNVSDANGFGTLYQFGRGTDGHEIRTSSLSVGPSGSTTPGSNFLTKAGAPFNWYSGTNPDNLWQGTSGINNPCPPTWRIPSQSEWVSEIASWSTQNAAGGFGSPLKLVSAGRRDNAGSVQEVGTAGYYWSYNTNAGLDTVKVIKITSSTAEGNTDDQRVEGMAVRCIKDEDAVFTPNSPTANFILTEDGLGECTGTVDINGIYKQGTALTASETVELSVFVVSPGAYSISTDLINGYSFTGTGTFNSTGNTTAILTNNNGTPLTDGVDTFTATLLGSNCTFSVDVDAYVPPPIYGTGLDGAVTLASNKNINTDTIATGRTCADGINYSVTALTTNSATLSTTPAAGCLAANDTVLLINLQGISTNYANTGNYELLTVQSATGTNVTFTSSKTKYYGNGASDDTNLGTATTNQRVMLQRVPNYTDVAINSGVSLTANAWDGIKGGVIAFKATGTTTVTGTIDADAKGFRGGPSRTGYYIVGQQGESHSNIGVQDRNPNSGGGGGGDKAGCPSYCYGAGGAAGGGYGTVGSDGGDGAYAADFGIQDRGLAGGIYGIDNLSKIYLGTGGGSGGTGNTSHTGGGGGTGGGIILLNSSQVTISGLIKSTGSNGSSGSPCSNYFPSAGGGASGGSILIYNNTINTGTNRITSLGGTSSSCAGATGGTGGFGRIAISGTVTGTTNPTYTLVAGSAPTPTPVPPTPTPTPVPPTPTPTPVPPTPTPSPTPLPIYGSGSDGAVIIASNKNINTDTIATSRTCADGINYSVSALTTNSATLSTTPAAGCLAANDTVLLINLQGISTNYANAGNYELLTVQSASGTNVTFTGNKTKYYGNGASDDTNIGTSTTNQRVMLQRVPNYTDVTVNNGVTLTASAWDNIKGGVLIFNASGTTTVSGTISMNGNGFKGGRSRSVNTGGFLDNGWGPGYPGESINGLAAVFTESNNLGGGGGGSYSGGMYGGGGGYGSPGENGVFWTGTPGYGGSNYGSGNLNLQIHHGSGGGGSVNNNGANAGGIIFISTNSVQVNGSISNNGIIGTCNNYNTSNCGGSGSGGSILIKSNTTNITPGVIQATGGPRVNYGGYYAGAGGVGRIAISGTVTGTTSPTYQQL